jgi:uncharacterized repeat protein (TIGR01451 family)
MCKLMITVRVVDYGCGGDDCNDIVNKAWMMSVDEEDLNHDNNDEDNPNAIVTLSVVEADLVITKAVDNATPIGGENVVYTINVTNEGGADYDDATNVEVTDDMRNLPVSLVGVVTNTGGAYDFNTGIWTVGDLAKGDTATLEVEVTVNDDACGDFGNSANITDMD